MDNQELLVRTMNAAKEARERGFVNTADAFDEIVENLLQILNSQIQPLDENRANLLPETLHMHSFLSLV
ncbi:hypothetical protein [uncultured Roseovarius sp.]|uniref:hypothetical protein n=1 Tax=uncultured Roseovarius sp. TaxID=293344 RepID=UPI0026347EE9|nr:hypothetical protein [uncultured Roseovarius sp.]